MQDFSQAVAFISALTGNADTRMNFRAIHETDRGIAARPRIGTLAQHWSELCQMNNEGFGIYCTVNETDGRGQSDANITGIRAQFIDLDGIDAQQQLTNACAWDILPQFYVQSSPGKFHIYWKVTKHDKCGLFTVIQRKLVTKFNADPTVIDPARIMRLPGSLHMKNPGAPTLVEMATLPAIDQIHSTEMFDAILWNVAASEAGGAGDRIPVGQGDRAPTTQDAIDMLNRIDICSTIGDRNAWVAITGAFIQSIDEYNTGFSAWMTWNEGYPGNDPAACVKLWNDTIERGTIVRGWKRLHKEATGLTPQQARLLGGMGVQHPDTPQQPVTLSSAPQTTPAVDVSGFGPILDPTECAQWFRDCVAITSEGSILCADNIFRDAAKFNMKFGGKAFVISVDGKTTDEPYKAATRSQLWTLPQAEFTCFRPDLPGREMISDGLDRKYVNCYYPAKIDSMSGDVTPFTRHLELVLPDENDRRLFVKWLAHNVKYPGDKIAWAPLLQGGEGLGKNVFKIVMKNAMNKIYFYQPKAKQLNESGAKFNGWMENKLFFLVDEIKTDDKREMIETLKPFISEKELEIEGKGSNQRMGDTPGNWLFFSNWKDALPITKETRRHAIFYSALQDHKDMLAAGMTDAYFDHLYDWLEKENGAQIATHYLLNYPIERGALPKRAPHTSSTIEAIAESRGWLEEYIAEAVSAQLDGFRGGWVATAAIGRIVAANGRKTIPSGKFLGQALKNLGYFKIGQAGTGYFRDNPENASQRSNLWHINKAEHIGNYARAQSYA